MHAQALLRCRGQPNPAACPCQPLSAAAMDEATLERELCAVKGIGGWASAHGHCFEPACGCADGHKSGAGLGQAGLKAHYSGLLTCPPCRRVDLPHVSAPAASAPPPSPPLLLPLLLLRCSSCCCCAAVCPEPAPSAHCHGIAVHFCLQARHVPPGQPRRAAGGRPGCAQGHADSVRPQGGQEVARSEVQVLLQRTHRRCLPAYSDTPPC